MAGDAGASVEVSHQEVLAYVADILEVGLPVHLIALIEALEDDCLCRRVDTLAEILSDSALDSGDLCLWLIDSNRNITDNKLRIGRVIVPLRRRRSQIVFQTVATVEKLADITTDVVSEDEATTWMLVNELFHVEHQVV